MLHRPIRRRLRLRAPAALALTLGASSSLLAQQELFTLPAAPLAPSLTFSDGNVPAAQQTGIFPNPVASFRLSAGPIQAGTPQQPYQNPLDQPLPLPSTQPAEPAPVSLPPSPLVASLPSTRGANLPELVRKDHLGSAYIPDDSVVYPMALRLYSMGYLDTILIGMRPWTRRSLLHALERSAAAIQADQNPQAMEIYAKLMDYLQTEVPGSGIAGSDGSLSGEMTRGQVYGVESAYTRLMGITGLTLRDSYHLGQTISNDYGRPYEAGFNNITGFSTLNELGRFSLYVRGEYQHAPSAAGYNNALASDLSSHDAIVFAPPNDPQDTIPSGPIATVNPFRLQEAALSFHLLGHEISGGKTDAWLGPAYGGAMAWSNNAEDIYSFRINRVEQLHIPYLSYLLGGLRYDFFVGSLKGHTAPNDPWIHSEMVSFKPTDNFEFAFQRSVIWGGKGHEPVTLHTFFRSLFSVNDTTEAEKASAQDPGARFSDFSFSWRLPYLRKHVTLYTDSIAHDDVTPVSAPRRAAYRPGLFLSQVPGLPRLDLRIEAASTDCSTLRCVDGVFNYFEIIQLQGYTNKGFIMGDWVGREAMAYQGWATYHLSANEWAQLSYMHKMTPNDFIQSGVSQSQIKAEFVKRLRPDIELDAWFQYEHWAAPIYQTNQQSNTVTAVRLAFYPKLHNSSALNGK